MNQVERLILAQAADGCVRWLKVQGLKVVRVDGNEWQPRIHVKYSALCERFEGIVQAYERCLLGERRTAWVYRFGCQIKWVVPNPNPHMMREVA